jgi:hypothetical protein
MRQPLFFFSRRAVVSGARPRTRADAGDLTAEKSCRGFSRLPIGSASPAKASPLNKRARFAGVRLQNRIGSAQVPKS